LWLVLLSGYLVDLKEFLYLLGYKTEMHSKNTCFHSSPSEE